MKLLRIKAKGLTLFKDEIDIFFYAKQRIDFEDAEMLIPLFSNIYLNPTNTFIGINASGKTSILKLISLVLGILNNEPINHIETKDILGNSKEVNLEIYFYLETTKEICHLNQVIKQDNSRYQIVSESLWTKKTLEVNTRKSLLEFKDKMPTITRNNQEDFLLDDVSVMIAINKKTNEYIKAENLLSYTNTNVLKVTDDIPKEIIEYLDPTIEELKFTHQDKKLLINLKFKGKDEILLNSNQELNQYLSSGTIKGIVIFYKAIDILNNGGYMLIDEIENHFNKEIVKTLMRFFMDNKVNIGGGVLVYSTHYPELLDEYKRNDSIFITRNNSGIEAENLSNILKRNDINKSDAYQSDLLKGTAPMYESYLKLYKRFKH